MSLKKKRPWQSLEMLPVAEDKVRDALETSQLTLLNLEAMKNSPDILSGKTSEQLVHANEEQQNQLLLLREQCRHWHRTEYITQAQKESLITLENNISRLEKLTQQILFITRHFASPPIDSMFTKGAVTLNGEVFTKKDFAHSVITMQQQEMMQVVHNRFSELEAQGVERIERFFMMLDYLPIIDDIISNHNRTVVMDSADSYPGFREYILLFEEIGEKLHGLQLRFMPDA